MTKARTLADNFAADINGITAGTGITGGGTSGTVTITNDMATAINAKGDLVVGTGADAYARLAVASTAGYLLTVDSAETTGLKWAAPASGGKVLQVVSATYSTQTAIATTTWTDTGLTASITPSATTSKILVLVSQMLRGDRSATGIGGGHRLLRGSTAIFGDTVNGSSGYNFYYQSTGITAGSISLLAHLSYLDSPSTTSSTTYKMQANTYSAANSGSVTAQESGYPSSIILLEIGA